MSFALGQRWISDTESDSGLGTVVALDARTVTLMFAASEENRVYARSDAPVTRVISMSAMWWIVSKAGRYKLNKWWKTKASTPI